MPIHIHCHGGQCVLCSATVLCDSMPVFSTIPILFNGCQYSIGILGISCDDVCRYTDGWCYIERVAFWWWQRTMARRGAV